MIRLAGHSVCDEFNPDGDIEVVITGLRPGEKLHEELLIANGNAEGTQHPKILRANEPHLETAVLATMLDRVRLALEKSDEAELREVLMQVAR